MAVRLRLPAASAAALPLKAAGKHAHHTNDIKALKAALKAEASPGVLILLKGT